MVPGPPADPPGARPERPASSCVGTSQVACGRSRHALSRKGASRTGTPAAPVGEAPRSSTDRRTDVPTYPPAVRRDPRGGRPRPRRVRREDLRRRPRRRQQLRRGGLPGHGGQRSPWTSGPRRSSRCRPPRPRCSSPSAPASRSPPSTTSRTSRPTRPRASCPASSPTPRRSPRKNPDLVVLANDTNKIVAQLTALKIPVLPDPGGGHPRRLVPADHRPGHAHRPPDRGGRRHRRG